VPRSPSALHISIPPFQKGVQLQQLKLGGFCNLPGQFPLPILCGFFLLVATLPFCAASRLAMCFLSIPKTLFFVMLQTLAGEMSEAFSRLVHIMSYADIWWSLPKSSIPGKQSTIHQKESSK